MVVLHATDPATVYLSAVARLVEPSLDAVAAALYDDRTVARVLAMRRTLFVVPTDALPIVERSSTDAVAATERKRLEGFLADTGIDDPRQWLADAAAEVLAALPPEGAPARSLTAAVPRLATKIVMAAGTKHEATTGSTSRVLGVLANEGAVVRGRPAGEWTSRQHRWYRRDDWFAGAGVGTGADVGGGGSAAPSPTARLDLVGASAELVRRWLLAFGPATFEDLKWWTGWKVSQLKPALAAVGAVEVDLDGASGLALPDDLDDEPTPDPWVALLPSLDPTPMGWKVRPWYLGEHQPPLFDRNGNIGPTIWADGRIVGGWGQRPDGSIATRLLEDVGADHRALLDDEVSGLSAVIGDTVVKPSFPTPLQRELSA